MPRAAEREDDVAGEPPEPGEGTRESDDANDDNDDAESDDDKGRLPELVTLLHDLERILQTGIREGGELGEITLKVGETEDVSQSNAHLLGLMIAPKPA